MGRDPKRAFADGCENRRRKIGCGSVATGQRTLRTARVNALVVALRPDAQRVPQYRGSNGPWRVKRGEVTR